jgi:16S rRNA (guanine527-N7)-methyltransferase
MREMMPDRIAELLSPFLEGEPLSESQLGQIATYAALLEKWNARINLTAVRDHEEIITRHFGESLFAARKLFPAPETLATAIDIGSGAGFPGISLKIWSSALDLILIESNQKKAAFLREAVRTLSLANVKVLAERAEQVSTRANLITLRAVERFEQILPVALKLTARPGRIALLIGNSQVPIAKSVLTDVSWENPVPLPLSQNRSLLVGHVRASL